MNDHENVIVKQLKEKHQKLWEENCRLEDEVIRKASLPDKIHVYLMMLAVGVGIFSPIYMIVQLVRLPEEIHAYVSMVGFTMFIVFPIYVLVQLIRIHHK